MATLSRYMHELPRPCFPRRTQPLGEASPSIRQCRRRNRSPHRKLGLSAPITERPAASIEGSRVSFNCRAPRLHNQPGSNAHRSWLTPPRLRSIRLQIGSAVEPSPSFVARNLFEPSSIPTRSHCRFRGGEPDNPSPIPPPRAEVRGRSASKLSKWVIGATVVPPFHGLRRRFNRRGRDL
jgi:hypothetical protein